MKLYLSIFALAMMAWSDHGVAASCSAKNDSGDKCNVDCPTGQKAYCQNAAGAGTPTCECKVSSNRSNGSMQDRLTIFDQSSAARRPAVFMLPAPNSGR